VREEFVGREAGELGAEASRRERAFGLEEPRALAAGVEA
jgi:hypothetical protein